MSCLVIGDSIAVGISHYLKCDVSANVGASSSSILKRAPSGKYDVVVISAGSNDPQSKNLTTNIKNIKSKYTSARFVIVLPYNRVATRRIKASATNPKDTIIDLVRYHTNDGIHPTNYKHLATNIRTGSD